jgi:hypothetical protein
LNEILSAIATLSSISPASTCLHELRRALNAAVSSCAIDEAAKRGRTVTALTAIEGQRKGREALSAQRQREASTLADLKAEHAALGAKGRKIESEATPVRYVAELVGADIDSERAIRWLILMIVLTCDPSAIVLTASAASARR